MLRLGVIVLCALALAGCGGDDDESPEGVPSPASSETTPAEIAGGSRCEEATTDIMTPLGNKLTVEGGRVRAGQIVKSRDHETMYFVSAEIDGSGLEDAGDVATWATANRFGGDAVYAVDELAKQHSDWSDSTEIDVTIDDDGAEESRECVAAAG